MKIAIGFAFTSGPIESLKARGFHFEDQIVGLQPSPEHEIAGFKLEVVQDETDYRSSRNEHPFWPHLKEVDAFQAAVHPNTVVSVKRAITTDLVKDPELVAHWANRKFGPFVALWIHCADIETFKRVAKPDKQLRFEGETVFVVEMGPNCFDLLVSKMKA